MITLASLLKFLLYLYVSTAIGGSYIDVPIIDVQDILNISAAYSGRYLAVSRQIGRACKEIGFFHVINHGIDLKDLYSASKSFFDLPNHQKMEIKREHNNSRGYADDELTKQVKDRKEIYDIGHSLNPHLPDKHVDNINLDGFNQWVNPKILPYFRPTIEQYYELFANISRVLLASMAVDLGLKPIAFEHLFNPHTSFIRLNYYPDESHFSKNMSDSDYGSFGVSRHTDAGILTVLVQDQQKGLEVYSGSKEHMNDGSWISVTPVPGALTINTGDMLQVLTNDKYKAPEHRVARSRDSARYSIPFFFNPRYNATISPLVDSDVPKYQPFTWGYFRRIRYQGDFADYGKEIQIEDFKHEAAHSEYVQSPEL